MKAEGQTLPSSIEKTSAVVKIYKHLYKMWKKFRPSLFIDFIWLMNIIIDEYYNNLHDPHLFLQKMIEFFSKLQLFNRNYDYSIYDNSQNILKTSLLLCAIAIYCANSK